MKFKEVSFQNSYFEKMKCKEVRFRNSYFEKKDEPYINSLHFDDARISVSFKFLTSKIK